jgi:hypothetical protein
VGLELCDAQPWGAADYRERSISAGRRMTTDG